MQEGMTVRGFNANNPERTLLKQLEETSESSEMNDEFVEDAEEVSEAAEPNRVRRQAETIKNNTNKVSGGVKRSSHSMPK